MYQDCFSKGVTGALFWQLKRIQEDTVSQLKFGGIIEVAACFRKIVHCDISKAVGTFTTHYRCMFVKEFMIARRATSRMFLFQCSRMFVCEVFVCDFLNILFDASNLCEIVLVHLQYINFNI